MRKPFLVLLAVLPALCLPAAADESDGKVTYESRCAVCHGKDGVPKAFAKGSAAFNDQEWKKARTLEEIVQIITEGRKRMPSFRNKLTPEQVRSVAAYLKTL